MKYDKTIVYLLVALFFISSAVAAEMPPLQKILEKRLQNCNCSVILVDPYQGNVLASLNSDPIVKEKHPPGSLMKVFTLIAFAQTHTGQFPEYQCPPSLARDPKGCWDRNGHGNVNAKTALAVSCNVYFRQLSLETSLDAFEDVTRRFGVLSKGEEWKDQQTAQKLMTGATLDWTVSPVRLVRAYCSFFNGGTLWNMQSSNNEVLNSTLNGDLRDLIRNGLRESSFRGTSTEARAQAGVSMLGKTGTSTLLINGKADYSRTQGWWIGLYPEQDPEIAIMTFVRNGRGASDAAPNGGRALTAWLEYTRRNTHLQATGKLPTR